MITVLAFGYFLEKASRPSKRSKVPDLTSYAVTFPSSSCTKSTSFLPSLHYESLPGKELRYVPIADSNNLPRHSGSLTVVILFA